MVEKVEQLTKKAVGHYSVRLSMVATAVFLAYESAIHLVEPISRHGAITTIKELTQTELPTNPNYMNLKSQIKAAIADAEARGIYVTYDRPELDINSWDLVRTGYFITRHEIGDIVRNRSLDGGYFKFMADAVIQDQLPPEIYLTIINYGSSFDNFRDMTEIPYSGFNRRQTPKEDIENADRFIESEVEQNQGMPIPPWKILTYWLIANNGNFNEAINDAAIYSKAKIRNDQDGNFIVDESEAIENVNFFIKNIEDQTSLLGTYTENYKSYGVHNQNENYSTVELISLIYDGYIQAALLNLFPPSMGVAMTEAQMWAVYEDAGMVKSLTNISSATGLYELHQYLNRLPKN